MEKTNVMRILEKNNIKYSSYDYSKTNAISGVEVATILNIEFKKIFKTLVTIGKTKKYYVFLLPVDDELDLKKAAFSVREKTIEMVKSKDLLSIVGYIHGGCSPIGMKKEFPIIIDSKALINDEIIFSAGKIGYQVSVKLDDLKKVINFSIADICKDNDKKNIWKFILNIFTIFFIFLFY